MTKWINLASAAFFGAAGVLFFVQGSLGAALADLGGALLFLGLFFYRLASERRGAASPPMKRDSPAQRADPARRADNEEDKSE